MSTSVHKGSGWDLRVLLEPGRSNDDRLPLTIEFRRQISAAFWSYDVPLTVRHQEEGQGPPQYAIKHVDAERLLCNIWPGSRHGTATSRFFKLPPELRNTIYEMVFQYPASGIFLRRLYHAGHYKGKGPMTVALLKLSPDPSFDFPKWKQAAERNHLDQSPYADGLLRAAPLEKVLSSLLVSRQFHREALPVFYHINHFHFPTIRDLNESLEGIALSRLQYFAHVSFGYGVGERTGVTSAFTSLGMMTGLRRLDIEVDEAKWRWIAPFTEGPKKTDGLNFVGLAALRRVKADEVNFYGPCPTFETALKADMTRPKQTETAVAKPRKRKVSGDGGRKAKTGKVEKQV
ncbi:hypothetical protein LTR85_006822 [Meristemomyces frigidus]|nr:hypothetical protein LTR85_006822 [Meristemomyces frigidus]